MNSSKETPKKFLFVGGVHGVGKTTLLKELKESFDGKLGLLSQNGRVSEFLFEHRDQIRDTAEICWYARFVEMLMDALHDESTNRFLVDRTILDFIPYTDPASEALIKHDAPKFLKFLENRGHEINQVFLSNSVDVISDRIKSRGRHNEKEEISTLKKRMDSFKGLAAEFRIKILKHDTIAETRQNLADEFPEFFEV